MTLLWRTLWLISRTRRDVVLQEMLVREIAEARGVPAVRDGQRGRSAGRYARCRPQAHTAHAGRVRRARALGDRAAPGGRPSDHARRGKRWGSYPFGWPPAGPVERGQAVLSVIRTLRAHGCLPRRDHQLPGLTARRAPSPNRPLDGAGCLGAGGSANTPSELAEDKEDQADNRWDEDHGDQPTEEFRSAR